VLSLGFVEDFELCGGRPDGFVAPSFGEEVVSFSDLGVNRLEVREVTLFVRGDFPVGTFAPDSRFDPSTVEEDFLKGFLNRGELEFFVGEFDERSWESFAFWDEGDAVDPRVPDLPAFVEGSCFVSAAVVSSEASSASRAFRASVIFFTAAGLGMFIGLSPLCELVATALSSHG
jgi:hypothetical protein